MIGYPLVLVGLSRMRCVVVGGGHIAARKAQAIVEAGARPVVISPALCDSLEALVSAGEVTHVRRDYRRGDCAGAMLVVAATDDSSVNRQVSCECRSRRVLVNVVDQPDDCSFYAPAVIRRGGLMVAVSTGGGSPAFARHMREMLEGIIDPAHGVLLSLLAEARPGIKANVAPDQRKAVWDELLDGQVMDCLRAQGESAARNAIASIVESHQSAT